MHNEYEIVHTVTDYFDGPRGASPTFTASHIFIALSGIRLPTIGADYFCCCNLLTTRHSAWRWRIGPSGVVGSVPFTAARPTKTPTRHYRKSDAVMISLARSSHRGCRLIRSEQFKWEADLKRAHLDSPVSRPPTNW